MLVVQGGGRAHGNTAQLVDAFIQGAKEAGHLIDKVSLLETEVKGCLGCNACRYGKPCIQKDGFHEIVPKMKEADMIVFASPLYFWTISARLKALIERFYSIAQEDPEKDCVLLMSAADDNFWTFEQAVSYYRFTLVNYIGFHDVGMVLAGGCGDTNGLPQISKAHLKEAYLFGKTLNNK